MISKSENELNVNSNNTQNNQVFKSQNFPSKKNQLDKNETENMNGVTQNSKFQLKDFSITKSMMTENHRYDKVSNKDYENEQGDVNNTDRECPKNNAFIDPSNPIKGNPVPNFVVRNPFDSFVSSNQINPGSSKNILRQKSDLLTRSSIKELTNNKFNNNIEAPRLSTEGIKLEITENLEEEEEEKGPTVVRQTETEDKMNSLSNPNNGNIFISTVSQFYPIQTRESIPYAQVQLNSDYEDCIKEENIPDNITDLTSQEIKKNLCCIFNDTPIYHCDLYYLENSIHFSIPENLKMSATDEEIDKLFYDITSTANIKRFEELSSILHSIKSNDTRNCVSDLIATNILNFKQKRNILSDGDGLIRALVYRLMEMKISYKDTEFLKKIAYDAISNEPDFQDIIIIFKQLFTHIDSNEVRESLIVFHNAFWYVQGFSNSLIQYARRTLGNYIIFNKNYFKTSEITKIFPSKYVTLSDNIATANYDELINEALLKTKTNLDHLILLIFPLFFEVNIKLFIGNRNEEITFSANANTQNNIYLHYSNFNYILLYESSDIQRFNLKISMFQTDLKNVLTILANSSPCSECGKVCKVTIIDSCTKPVCIECLKNYIQTVIIPHRTKLIKTHKYNICQIASTNLPIATEPQKNIQLTNVHISQLFSDVENAPKIESIGELIRNKLKEDIKCDVCSNKDIKKCFLQSCGCIYCENCLREAIMRGTNNNVILNNYEKKRYPSTVKCKKCELEIPTPVESVRALYEPKEVNKLEKKAGDRLLCMISTQCCICEIKETEDTFEVNTENGKSIKHHLCKKCKENMDRVAKFGDGEVNCAFCNKKHPYKISPWNKRNEEDLYKQKAKKNKNNNKCCNIF